jgi:hypothetical protein
MALLGGDLECGIVSQYAFYSPNCPPRVAAEWKDSGKPAGSVFATACNAGSVRSWISRIASVARTENRHDAITGNFLTLHTAQREGFPRWNILVTHRWQDDPPAGLR